MKAALSKEYVEYLIHRGEIIGEEEYHPSKDGFFPDYVDGPKYDIWMNEINIFNERYLQGHPIYSCITNSFQNHKSNISAFEDMIGYLRALAEDDEFWDEIEKEDVKMEFQKLPTNCEELLYELVEAENPSEYLSKKYMDSSEKEQEILWGIIKDLCDNEYISVNWYDDCPQIVFLFNKARTYHESLLRYERINAIKAQEEKQRTAMYDVFISHANADKLDYVNDLKQSLDKLRINVFYDKDTLEWGDKWKDKILEGVAKAEFAIIVISENFFGREWTEKELQEFLNRQNTSGQKIILPILHNISVSQLQEQYPAVADIQALNSSKHTCDEIALEFAGQLIKRLKAK